MTVLTAISIILNIVLLFCCKNLITKLEKHEDAIEENDKFINDELERNNALLEALRQIDSRQMFEKDDDVGSIFGHIKQTIERFKTKTENYAEEKNS